VDFVFLSPNRGLPFFSLSPVSQIPICLKFALGDLVAGGNILQRAEGVDIVCDKRKFRIFSERKSPAVAIFLFTGKLSSIPDCRGRIFRTPGEDV
jgi:hypothetical protein